MKAPFKIELSVQAKQDAPTSPTYYVVNRAEATLTNHNAVDQALDVIVYEKQFSNPMPGPHDALSALLVMIPDAPKFETTIRDHPKNDTTPVQAQWDTGPKMEATTPKPQVSEEEAKDFVEATKQAAEAQLSRLSKTSQQLEKLGYERVPGEVTHKPMPDPAAKRWDEPKPLPVEEQLGAKFK
jgi:hypothetical protein